jgi:hypothetical protein
MMRGGESVPYLPLTGTRNEGPPVEQPRDPRYLTIPRDIECLYIFIS